MKRYKNVRLCKHVSERNFRPVFRSWFIIFFVLCLKRLAGYDNILWRSFSSELGQLVAPQMTSKSYFVAGKHFFICILGYPVPPSRTTILYHHPVPLSLPPSRTTIPYYHTISPSRTTIPYPLSRDAIQIFPPLILETWYQQWTPEKFPVAGRKFCMQDKPRIIAYVGFVKPGVRKVKNGFETLAWRHSPWLSGSCKKQLLEDPGRIYWNSFCDSSSTFSRAGLNISFLKPDKMTFR